MKTKAAAAELKFRAFSDTTRLRILHLLLRGEMCVCDIVEIVGVPQPTASRHLAYLRKSGLVLTEKRGFWTYYALAPANTPFHRSLLNCLKNCFEEVDSIQQDTARRQKVKANCR